MRGSLLGVALALALIGAAGGARAEEPADWAAVVAAAKQEGRLSIYNGTAFPIVRQIADRFEKASGIGVDVLDGRASEIRERIRAEQSAGRAIGDMAYSGATSIGSMTADGAFRQHGALPNATRLAPEFADNGIFVPASSGGFAVLINTNLVKPDEEPKSWLDFLDPKWQGKLLTDDPRAAGAGEVWFEATLTAFGRGFHEKFHAQKPVFSRIFAENERRLARGEFSIYLPFNVSEYPSLKGLPVKVLIPDEGIPYLSFGMAVLRDAPHPNAARIFMSFVLDDDQQTLLATGGFGPSVAGMADKIPEDLRPLVQPKLLGTSTPSRFDEMLKLASEIYQ
jgi:iron(III) transport system substrate-binding protein